MFGTRVPRPAHQLAAGVLLLIALTATSRADQSARWFPPGAMVHAEINDLAGALDQLRGSAAWNQLMASPQYQQIQSEEDMRKVFALRTIVERQLGMDVWTAAKQLAGHCVAVAVYPGDDPKEPRAVMVAHTESPEALANLHKQLEPLFELASDQLKWTEALDGGRQVSFQDNVFAAWKDQWLVVSNNAALLDATRQAISGHADSTLANDAPYQRCQADLAATRTQDASRLVEVYANLELVQQQGSAIPERLDQPLLSLLIGDTLARLRHSPYAALTVDRGPKQLVARLTMAAASELSQAHLAFFPPQGQPGARPMPDVAGRVGGMSLYRDFAAWYGQREQLLEPQVLPGFDKFETGLANILPGKDFGTDILPLIGSRLVFVAAPQEYQHLEGRPGVELPGFGLVVELANPEEGAAIFQLFFQTITAILNLEAGQQGREPWIMTTEVYHDVPISMARYLKKPAGDRLGIVFNFLPAAAQVEDHYVICSSVELCRQLVDRLKQPWPEQQGPPETLRAEVRAEAVARLLTDNQDFFLGRIMQEGKTAEQAQQEWQAILGALEYLDAVNLKTVCDQDRHHVQLQWSWK